MATAIVLPIWMRQQEEIAVSPVLFANKAVALDLAKLQIEVFPCKDDKKPAVKEDWEGNASCDPGLPGLLYQVKS